MMLLSLAGIGKLFGNRVVLRHVSLEIGEGTICLLMGANGAGKTTLLRIMAGLATPSAGVISSACEDGEIGYLGHSTFLYPGLSALENLMFWNRMGCRTQGALDLPGLLAILDRVQLSRYAEERAGTFSRGMAQRLNLARILLQEPKLLLLDEPGTGLDTASLALLHQEISAAKDRGAGVVWISHDVTGDATRADRLLVIAERTLAYDGPPDGVPDCIAAPSTPQSSVAKAVGVC